MTTGQAAEESRVRATRLWRRLFWPVAVSVQGALLALFYLPASKMPLGDEKLYLEAARAVAESGSSQLDPLWPPLYAWFLAPMLAATGGEVWLAQAVQIALWFACAWMIGRLTTGWTDSDEAGALAALLAVAYPTLAAFSHYLWPEVLHLTLFLAGVMALERARGAGGIVAAAAAGLLLALCLHTKALLTVLLPAVVLGLAFTAPRARRWVVAGTLMATLMAGVAVPILASGGEWQWARSGWFNVWVGLSDTSRHEFVEPVVGREFIRYRDSAPTAAEREARIRLEIVDRVERQGWWSTALGQLDRQYFRLFDKDSFLTIQLPGGAANSEVAGYQRTPQWAVSALRCGSYLAWAALLVAAALGVALFDYRRRPIGWWVLGYVAVQLALFFWLHVKTRYRLQMLPALIFFAAVAWTAWSSRRSASTGSFRARLAGGGVLATLGLWLAFGADVG